MKISCLIATYRADDYIGKALESIRAQSHADWEIVVVEDGSRGQTEAIVGQFAASVSQPVRYENLGVNRGVATARTRLMELAQGEAIAFLDADDWWTQSHLANADRAFAAGADFVVAPIQLYNLDTHEAMQSYAPPEILYQDPVRELFTHSAIMTSSCVAIRTALVRKVGAFEPTLRIGEDRDYWLRCAAAGASFAGTGEVTCFYSKHATSTMAKTLLWAEQEVLFHEKHFGFSGVPKSVRRERLAHVLTNYGRLVRATDRTASRRALGRAFRLRPSLRGLALSLRSLA